MSDISVTLSKCGRFVFGLIRLQAVFFFFFFNDTATTEIYTLSLHDALPILEALETDLEDLNRSINGMREELQFRSEEHTSELQSQSNLVCRLLLEKKNKLDRNILAMIPTRTLLSELTMPHRIHVHVMI